MIKQTLGATPAEWDHFAHVLDIEADLLPVVSNPAVAISSASKMKQLGKTPSRVNAYGEAVGIPGWSRHEATIGDIKSWSRNADHGICIQTRRVRALDIDIDDPSGALVVQRLSETVLGLLPVRSRSNSGKRLLMFRMAGSHPKRVIRTANGLIEFLGNGQQFIAVGTHPSGQRYEWDGGGDSLPVEIPEIDVAEFNGLWDMLVRKFAIEPELRASSNATNAALLPRNARDALEDPVGDWLIEHGKSLQIDKRTGRIDVECPWIAEHSSDSGPTQTSYFPPGVGGVSKAGWRCQHAHCAARNLGDYLRAVGYDDDEFEDVTAQAAELRAEVLATLDPIDLAFAEPEGGWPTFARDNKGRIEPEARNMQRALTTPSFTGVLLGWDDFKAQVSVCWQEEAQLLGELDWRPLRDTDYFRLQVVLESRGFKSVNTALLRAAVARTAEINRFDSAKTWIDGLRWDGVERVGTFLGSYMGCTDNAYTQAVSTYMWSALAGRTISPGCKADMVPVLVGPQGNGKTTGVQALAPEPDAFVELSLDVRDDDLSRRMRGAMVGELGELRGLSGKNGEAIRQWITRTHEEWTPKYFEHKIKFARRLLLIGTTNQDAFLEDDTGTGFRRWLPLDCYGLVRVDAIERDRLQLWAEAAEIFRAQGVVWAGAQTLARGEHANYEIQDDWAHMVVAWLDLDSMGGTEGVKNGADQVQMSDVLTGALGIRVADIKLVHSLRVGKILRKLGYEKVKGWANGKQAKVWKRI